MKGFTKFLFPEGIIQRWVMSLKNELCNIHQGFPGGTSGQEPAYHGRGDETWLQSLDQEDPLEKEIGTRPSTPASRIPWTEEPGGVQSMRLQSQIQLSN